MDQGDLTSVLSSLMANPEMLSRVKEVASKLDFGGNGRQKPAANTQSPADDTLTPCDKTPKCRADCETTAKNRRRLIEALEPFLSEERCETAKRLLLITELIDSAECINCLKGR